jgi:hypothetical protein
MATSTAVTTQLCPGCTKRLDEASSALRLHASEMNRAFELSRNAGLTEERMQTLKTRLAETFNEAQSEWDAYREHLAQHGILPERL